MNQYQHEASRWNEKQLEETGIVYHNTTLCNFLRKQASYAGLQSASTLEAGGLPLHAHNCHSYKLELALAEDFVPNKNSIRSNLQFKYAEYSNMDRYSVSSPCKDLVSMV